MPFFAGAQVLNRPHSITADVEIPEAGAEGVLLAQGTSAGGFTLYVKDRRLHYTHNWVARELLHVASDAELSAGRHELRFEFEPTGDARPREGSRKPGPPAALHRRRARRRPRGPVHDAVRCSTPAR